MKKLIFLLTFSAGVAITGFAQTPQTAPSQQNVPSQPSSKKNELNLSQDQQNKYHQINEDEKSKRQAIQNNSSLTADQKTAQLKTLKKESKLQKKSLLTDDQKNMQKQIKAEKKANGTAHSKHKSNSGSSSQSNNESQQ